MSCFCCGWEGDLRESDFNGLRVDLCEVCADALGPIWHRDEELARAIGRALNGVLSQQARQRRDVARLAHALTGEAGHARIYDACREAFNDSIRDYRSTG